MKNALFLLLLIVSISLVAQDKKIAISGSVVERETGAPIAWASILVKDKGIGVTSNEMGEFDLFIPATSLNDSILISAIGFKTFGFVASEVAQKSNTIFRLETHVIQLEEVVVTAISAESILERINENFAKNYPSAPFALEGFYREVVKENKNYAMLLEAAIGIYDKGIASVKNHRVAMEDVSIHELRKSFLFIQNADRRYRVNLLSQLIGSNDIRNRSWNALNNGAGLKMTRGEDIAMNGSILYTLEIEMPNVKAILYVDAESFGVTKMETVLSQKRQIYQNDSITSYQTGVRTTYEYRKFKDKYYLNYGVKSSDYEIFNKASKTTTFQYNFRATLAINEIKTENVSPPKKKEVMNNNLPLIHLKKNYNAPFWKDYNLLKQTPVDEKIMADLEKKIPLSNQFNQK